MRYRLMIPLAAALTAAGCAVAPTGPDVLALPGTGRNFEEFRADDYACRDYAAMQISGKTQAANEAAMRNAAVGTAVGTVAGAAIGGRSSAGVGAGMGLVVGSASGAEATRSSMYGSQRQYDNAYIQCMYAKGHRVPVSGNYTLSPAPQPATVPPPPPGTPPPPPPR
jgi:hypothetical protein